MKTHLRCVTGNVKLIFEEFTMVLAQVEPTRDQSLK